MEVVVQARRGSRQENPPGRYPERLWDADPSGDADWPTPCCQEKLLASRTSNRTKTDTGGMVEHTKARERNLVKELGKLAP